MAKMIRPKKAALPSWTDKVAATADLIRRTDETHVYKECTLAIIRWKCLVNMFGALVPRVLTSVVVSNVSDDFRKYPNLIDTLFGPICPHCLTNEFIRSQNDFLSASNKQDHPGHHCACCGRLSIQ
jgi:hypothetical protein